MQQHRPAHAQPHRGEWRRAGFGGFAGEDIAAGHAPVAATGLDRPAWRHPAARMEFLLPGQRHIGRRINTGHAGSGHLEFGRQFGGEEGPHLVTESQIVCAPGQLHRRSPLRSPWPEWAWGETGALGRRVRRRPASPHPSRRRQAWRPRPAQWRACRSRPDRGQRRCRGHWRSGWRASPAHRGNSRACPWW